RYKPGVTRLVLDLKSEVRPQAFTLPPVAEYGHRLVLDIYPLVPVDPLLAFLEQREAQRQAVETPVTRPPEPSASHPAESPAARPPAPATNTPATSAPAAGTATSPAVVAGK